MTRNFADTPVAPELVDDLIDVARRAPSAGNTSATHYVVLEGASQVAQYWDVTLPAERRASFPWPGLLQAPVLVVLWTDPLAYVKRYGESDKARTGLGDGVDVWSVPYWFVDGGMAGMSLLLGAADAGLGALFFGVFEHEPVVRSHFGVPEHMRAVGTVALGYPAATQRRSLSADRARAPLDTQLHRARW